EVTVLEVETTHHGLNGAVLRTQRYQSGLYGGFIDHAPIIVDFVNIDHRSATDTHIVLGILDQAARHDFQGPLVGDLNDLLSGACNDNFVGCSRQHHGGE